MMNEMLHPGKVGISFRWDPKLPSHIILKKLTAPIAIIERWIGEDEICPQVLVLVIQETSLIVPFHQVRLYSSYGQIHLAQPPSCLIAFLTVNGDISDLSSVSFNEFLALDEHPSRAAARVEDSSLVRL